MPAEECIGGVANSRAVGSALRPPGCEWRKGGIDMWERELGGNKSEPDHQGRGSFDGAAAQAPRHEACSASSEAEAEAAGAWMVWLAARR
jgi:hypothetical protein